MLAQARLARVLATRPDNTNGLVARYPASSLGGSSASPILYDASGNNLSLTYVAGTGVAVVESPYGPAISGTGINFSSTSTALQPTPAQGVTYSAWVKPGSVSGNNTLWGSSNTGNPLLLVSNNNVYMTATGFADAEAVGVAAIGRWMHVAGSYGGSIWSIYINGVLIANVTAAEASWPTGSVGIGHQSGVFTGAIADFRLYNRTLALAEVYGIYASTNVQPDVEPMALYQAVSATIHSMSASPSSYAFSPAGTTLKSLRKLTASPSAFSFSTVAATERALRHLSASAAAYTISPATTALKSARYLAASAAAFAFSSPTATLTKVGGSMTYTLSASPATLTWVDEPATFKVRRALAAQPATFTFSGVSSTLTSTSTGTVPISGTLVVTWAAQASAAPTWAAQASATAGWSI